MCHLWATVHSNIKSFEECSFADSNTQDKSITYAKKFGGWYRSRNENWDWNKETNEVWINLRNMSQMAKKNQEQRENPVVITDQSKR